jgi:hypothetical protein
MKPKRFLFPKITVIIITVVLLALLIVAIVLQSRHPQWIYGNTLLLTTGIALVLQVIINGINWRSQKKIVILATLFISATLAASVLWRFISLNTLAG